MSRLETSDEEKNTRQRFYPLRQMTLEEFYQKICPEFFGREKDAKADARRYKKEREGDGRTDRPMDGPRACLH